MDYLKHEQKQRLLKSQAYKNLQEMKQYIYKTENSLNEDKNFISCEVYTKAIKKNVKNIEELQAFSVELHRKKKNLD